MRSPNENGSAGICCSKPGEPAMNSTPSHAGMGAQRPRPIIFMRENVYYAHIYLGQTKPFAVALHGIDNQADALAAAHLLSCRTQSGPGGE